MKHLTNLMVACVALTMCATASVAQDSYNKVTLGFESLHTTYDFEPTDVSKGLSLGYAHGFFFSQRVPLFLETGAKLAWTHRVYQQEEFVGYSTTRLDFLNAQIPVDFGYKFSLFNDNLCLAPFTGPNFKFNIIGRRQKTIGQEEKHYDSENFMSRDVRYPANVFQFGWRVGAVASHGRFSVGYAFTYDFTDYRDIMSANASTAHFGEQKTASHSLTVGYSF